MSESDYSIEEILTAIDEINEKSNLNKSIKNEIPKIRSEIPVNTLKIIRNFESFTKFFFLSRNPLQLVSVMVSYELIGD